MGPSDLFDIRRVEIDPGTSHSCLDSGSLLRIFKRNAFKMCAKYRFISLRIVATNYLDLKRLYDSNHCFTRLTERAYHLNEICRGIFWTNGTALYLSMEMDRFDPKFRNTRGREPGQQQRWRQTYCVLAEPHP